jgi:hypothetical protein
MHALKIVHQLLTKNCTDIHKTRLAALMNVVESLLYGQTLTVTGLGRASRRATLMKHSIKQSDRLIGNPHLTHERRAIYQALAILLLGAHRRPLILVDWSDYTYNRTHLILRAAVPVGGRALTLYEEVHPYRCYGNARIQHAFLKTLKSLIPDTHTPIIVTDAGFCGPWFRCVRKLGWDYIGRIRKSVFYRQDAGANWRKCEGLHAFATTRPRYVGEVALARSNPMACHLYLYKKPRMGRCKKTVYGQPALSKHSKKNAERERTPWVLASSLGPEDKTAKQIMRLYRTRMQIEEGFRDIKNHRYGFALTDTRSYSDERLANLLLVGMLATWVLWMLGKQAEHMQWHYQYQANTQKHQRVLSLFYLGCLRFLQGQFRMTQSEYTLTIKLIRQDMINQAYER